MKRLACALAVSLVAFSGVCLAETGTSSAPKSINLTIYNQNFGLVKDVREVELKDGINYLRFEDIASKIDPTSVSFQSLTAPNAVQVLEQNYQYDVMNPETILNKSIGKNVKFRQFLAGGQVHELSGTLLNSPQVVIYSGENSSIPHYQGLVVKTADGVVLRPEGEIELAELPAGLISKPSLLWKIKSTKPGMHQTEIAYQTQDMNWHCDYVAIDSADDTALDLTSWVTLDNKSGASYKDAHVKLMAGDVHRVQPAPAPVYAMKARAGGVNESQFAEEAFAEYHLYTLSGTTDVSDNETKQLSLFQAANIPAKKSFVFEPQTNPYVGRFDGGAANKDKVQVKMEFENSKEHHLGMPMPKGKIRVYKKDTDGSLQFIGEDMIDHTPRDEKVRIYVGNAFDLICEQTKASTARVSNKVEQDSYEVSLRNHKDQDVVINCIEHAYGQWKIITSSLPYTQKDANTFEFAVKVPAQGEVKLTYTVETKTP